MRSGILSSIGTNFFSAHVPRSQVLLEDGSSCIRMEDRQTAFHFQAWGKVKPALGESTAQQLQELLRAVTQAREEALRARETAMPPLNEQEVDALLREPLPYGWMAVALGAFFGLVAYATYDLTSLALVEGFPDIVAVVDMAWGTVLTATVAAAGYTAARWISGQ